MANVKRQLSGIRLEFAVAQSLGQKIIGEEDGPFAVLSEDRSAICVFGGSNDAVVYSSFLTDQADVALAAAQYLGATLRVVNGAVECEIQGLVSTGKDFLEAAMRGLVDFSAADKE